MPPPKRSRFEETKPMNTTSQDDVGRPRNGPRAHVVDVVRGGSLKGEPPTCPRHHDHAADVAGPAGSPRPAAHVTELDDDHEMQIRFEQFERERLALAGSGGMPF